MRVMRLGQLGLVAAVVGGGCGEQGTPATTTETAELQRPKLNPFEAIVKQENTVADQQGFAAVTDNQLQNAWGLVFKGDSVWIAANPGTPVANIRVPNEGAAVYKGDAIAWFHGRPRLFATDFQNRKIDAFEADYSPAKLGGDFVDPELAKLVEPGTTEMYAPFNIIPFGDKLLVSFALQKGPDNEDDDAGAGRGFIDIFDTDGHYVQRLISRGKLNSPWGMVVSREHHGDVDLIVGNFGDGHINVYDLSLHGPRVRAAFEGEFGNRKGDPIVIEGLWGLAFGSGRAGFGEDDLYFAAGPGNGDEIETHGLFGELDILFRR
jgi:uncharacterized protein (TIGR03118 family)